MSPASHSEILPTLCGLLFLAEDQQQSDGQQAQGKC